ncbi:hypothetical protein M426DRAFT_15115 [Hypoxylon sp. CI-4A]|nr:hypothetical protein M426DRAFT_15115 [Hypoxylon sp. CI-4A]
MTSIPEDQQKNYDVFRDCLSTALIEKISKPQTKRKRKPKSKKPSSPTPTTTPAQNGDADADADLTYADDLADFADYIASETFDALPQDLKTLNHHTYTQDAELQARTSPAVSETLSTYGVTHDSTQGIDEFLAPVLTSFVGALTTAPPAPRATLRDALGCEMCGRDWVPLSYHHLIPRFVHAKAVRRGWHKEEDLQSVAWLCGACHRFVHRFAVHEDLARRFYTVELLMREEQVQRWAEWVSRLRWKGR